MMIFPGQTISRELRQFILMCLKDTEIKSELTKQIRVELDSERKKTNIGRAYNNAMQRAQSYDSLVSGDVNMQARMAASGYDVYGRTILTGNRTFNNNNAYRKMKNKIKYGRAPQNGYYNHGNYTIK